MSKFKTNNINDTEMVYSLLREKYPDNKIDINYNNKTSDYILKVTNEKFMLDPKVPVELKIKVIYGDTDSIFISMKFNRDSFTENRQDAFKMGIICGDNLTKEIFNRNPIELEFEKVFQPFILLTKKRYIGKKFENVKDPFKLKEITKAGTAASKRNYSKCIKNCYNEIIDCIVNKDDVSESLEIYKNYLDRIDNYQIEVDDLVVSSQLAKMYSCALCKTKCEWNRLVCDNIKCKVVSLPKSKKCVNCKSKFKCIHTFSLAHVTLAINMLSRNEEANVNDRIPYLYVEGDIKTKKSDLAEDPKFFINNKMKYNRIYYTESLAKTILSFFKVVLNEHTDLLDDAIEYTNEKLISYGAKKLRPSDFKMEEE